MISIINKLLQPLHYQLAPVIKNNEFPMDFDQMHKNIWRSVQPFTMTSPERVFSLIEAVKYIHRSNIQGNIVECGVWKGGSMMAVIETLKSCNDLSRELYLYDTYEGMSDPTEDDMDHSQQSAKLQLSERKKTEEDVIWAYSPLEAVEKNVFSTGYPKEKIHFVKGKVEETIPSVLPGSVALLRLDTDWYESTKHELHHLFPLLAKGGVLIIDDYGHWAGARKAVDEYFNNYPGKFLLQRIDNTGRLLIKQD